MDHGCRRQQERETSYSKEPILVPRDFPTTAFRRWSFIVLVLLAVHHNLQQRKHGSCCLALHLGGRTRHHAPTNHQKERLFPPHSPPSTRPEPPTSERRDLLLTSSAAAAAAAAAALLASVAPVRSAAAISSPAAPSDTSKAIDAVASVYDAVATSYDAQYSDSLIGRALDFDSLRRATLAPASGAVLELGIGSGLNLPHYPQGDVVSSIDGVDVSRGMLSLARDRARALMSSSSSRTTAEVRLHVADVARLPFPDDSFDVVADTFGLCVFADPLAVLREARRVLKPATGRLLLLEHDDGVVGRAMSFTRSTTEVAGTCRYDDDVLGLVARAGFEVESTVQRAGGFLRQVVARKVQ